MKNNQKIEVRKTKNRGQGVFAIAPIKKDEVLAKFEGDIYDEVFDDWTDEILDHCVQFEYEKWRGADGIADKFNHSCEPNCGIKGLFTIVAMRNIEIGEELTWDYEMTENNYFNWYMKCKCGSKICRKKIGRFDNMPQKIRNKYKGYISDWLVKK
jgi:uncharacterized protein